MARPTNEQAQSKQITGFSPIFGFGIDPRQSLVQPLSGFTLLREMERMYETDETVGAMAWCIHTTIGQVDWQFIPCVDGKVDEKDPQAVKMADWANTTLIDMTHTMMEHVEEALTMVPYGFAPCEIVTKLRDGVSSQFNDKYWGLDRIALRDQHTIFGWGYDDRQNLDSMRQMSYQGSATIPVWKITHYRTSSVLNRPQGRPLLLNAYRAWRLKNKIQDSEAIGIERDLCGLPMFRIPKAIISAAQEVNGSGEPTDEAKEAQQWIANAQKAVSDMRFNKTGGLIMPSDTYFEETADATASGVGDRTPMFDFKIVTTAGQRSIDTRTAARDYDRAIARAAMMQFLHLGDRSTGSYAMSDDQSSMAVRSLMFMAIKIAQEFQKKVTPLLWAVNGFDPRYMPRMRASEISKDSLQQVAAVMGSLGKAGGLWESDADMRVGLAKLINVPYDMDAQRAAADTARKTAEMNAVTPKPTFGAAPVAKSGDNEE